MSTTTGLILLGVLAVLALGLFMLAARNWSKASALYAPSTEEWNREAETAQAKPRPTPAQSPQEAQKTPASAAADDGAAPQEAEAKA